VSALPVVGAAVNVTVAPLTAFVNWSRTVTVMVAALEPLLAVIVPGAAVTSGIFEMDDNIRDALRIELRKGRSRGKFQLPVTGCSAPLERQVARIVEVQLK